MQGRQLQEKRMPKFRVMWGIIIDAKSPPHAAYDALKEQRNPESIATVFAIENLETGEQYMVDVAAENFVSFEEH